MRKQRKRKTVLVCLQTQSRTALFANPCEQCDERGHAKPRRVLGRAARDSRRCQHMVRVARKAERFSEPRYLN